ncbi:MAG: arginine deiminase-related protein, partial [Pseudanabaena sp.]
MTAQLNYLMCAPDHYDVDYVINPWMEGNVHKSSRDRAVEQWQKLYGVLKGLVNVELVPPEKGWPDMVFTANAGLVLGDKAVLSRFLHKERQGEEPYFKAWFESKGFTVFELPKDLPFEGAGDALFDRSGGWLWAGYGFRSELDAHPYLAKWLDVEVLSLRLIDNRFYHLDTCFCPLTGGYLLYYPPAFDSYSNRLIEMRVPADKRIAIEEADAVNFACNAVNVDRNVVMNKISDRLKQRITNAGFTVIETPLTEFLKAGGAAKCLTLRTIEVPIAAESSDQGIEQGGVEARIVELTGHLLDSGIINRALDLVTDNGGSFQVLEFNLGEQRQSTSLARIRISAPSHDLMETIMGELIEIGAVLQDRDTSDANLEPVLQNGVAPDDFYVSTIYPTDACVDGEWIRCNNQRMDAAIAISPDGKTA